MKYIFREEQNNIIYCVVPDNYILGESDTLIEQEQFMGMTIEPTIMNMGINILK